MLFRVENDFSEFNHSMEVFMEDQRDGQATRYGQQGRIVPPPKPSYLV